MQCHEFTQSILLAMTMYRAITRARKQPIWKGGRVGNIARIPGQIIDRMVLCQHFNASIHHQGERTFVDISVIDKKGRLLFYNNTYDGGSLRSEEDVKQAVTELIKVYNTKKGS